MLYTKSDIIEVLKNFASSEFVGEGNTLKIHSFDRNPEVVEECIHSKEDSYSNDQPQIIGPNRGKFPYIVALEGNIGAGKSTLLEKMRQTYLQGNSESEKYFGKFASSQIVFMPEPVDIWTSICDSKTGESILEKFYKDPKQYAFPFQVMVYNTHLDAFRKVVSENPDCGLLICERSIDAGRHIFAEMLYDDGMIDDVCFKVYKNLYDSTLGEFRLDAVLHLDVTPAICLERIGKRAREGEDLIPLEYLEKCDRYYKKWLANVPSY